MNEHRRRSPVRLEGRAVKAIEREGWEVVLEYEGEERAGPRLMDLSHSRKWLAQGSNLAVIEPWGLKTPANPGEVSRKGGFLVGRMGGSQAFVWRLGEVDGGDVVDGEPSLTEVTDGWLLLGMVGSQVFSVADKLTTLDLAEPGRHEPFLLQGPFAHIPASVVVLKAAGDAGAFLVACSRGYAGDLVQALLHAGDEFGIRPAGESALSPWLS